MVIDNNNIYMIIPSKAGISLLSEIFTNEITVKIAIDKTNIILKQNLNIFFIFHSFPSKAQIQFEKN